MARARLYAQEESETGRLWCGLVSGGGGFVQVEWVSEDFKPANQSLQWLLFAEES